MLGHLIGEHRSAHGDAWMLWEVAAAAEAYSRQLQRRQYSRRGNVSLPLPKPATTPLPRCALALIWGISVTLHHSYTLGPKENTLPALTQHIYWIITNAHIHTGSTPNIQTTVQHGTSKLDTCTQNTLKRSEPERSGLADRAHTHWHQCLYIVYSVAGIKTNCRVWGMWYGHEVTKISTSLHAGIIFQLVQQWTNMDNQEGEEVQSYFTKMPAVFYSIKYINPHNTDILWIATPANKAQGNKKET